MIRLRSVARWTTAASAAVLCVAALPFSAQADTDSFYYTAIGHFYYSDAYGATYYTTNFPSGVCLITPHAIYAINNTDQSIEVDASSDCVGQVRVVKPGESFRGNFSSAKVAS